MGSEFKANAAALCHCGGRHMCSVFIWTATESPQVSISAAVKTPRTIHVFLHEGLEKAISPPLFLFLNVAVCCS